MEFDSDRHPPQRQRAAHPLTLHTQRDTMAMAYVQSRPVMYQIPTRMEEHVNSNQRNVHPIPVPTPLSPLSSPRGGVSSSPPPPPPTIHYLPVTPIASPHALSTTTHAYTPVTSSNLHAHARHSNLANLNSTIHVLPIEPTHTQQHQQQPQAHRVQFDSDERSSSSGSEYDVDDKDEHVSLRPKSRSAPFLPSASAATSTGAALRSRLTSCLTRTSIMSNLRYYLRYYGPFRRAKNQPLYTAFLNRHTILFLLVLSMLIYLFAFSYSCTSMFGCRSWPFGPRPPRTNVPFTIISLLRDMSEESLVKDKSQFVIQWNALISWSMVVPPSQILIYMDTPGSCRKIMSQPELLGMTCLVVPCWHEEHKRPLLDCIFRVAHDHATTDIIAYVNGDILLHSDAQLLVNQVSSWFDDFLIVSRRTDTLVPQHVLDEFSTKSSQEQVLELLERAVTHGEMHSEFGIDLFCYPKRLFEELNFPPYLAGVYRWDNWLLSEMIIRENVAVIDATRQGLVVHQEMGKVGHQGRTGAAYNDAIAKGRSGLKYKIGNIKNTDYVIKYEPVARIGGGGSSSRESLVAQVTDSMQFRLVANHDASIEVLIAKRVNRDGWLAVIGVSHYDLTHGHVSNWLCWAQRINFTSYIFLAEDLTAGRELHRRGLPVLQFDEALERASTDATILVDSPIDGAGRPTDATHLDTFDFLMFRHEFLSIVLRGGFHFFWTHLSNIWLEDPLKYFQEGMRPIYGFKNEEMRRTHVEENELIRQFDFAGIGNETHFEGSSNFLVVRSTEWSKYMWKQIYMCEESNGAILYERTFADSHGHVTPRPRVIDCLNDLLHKHKSKTRRVVLPMLHFPNHQQFFVEQVTQTHGIMPVLVRDDLKMTRHNSQTLDASTKDNDETKEVDINTNTQTTTTMTPTMTFADRIQVFKANQIHRWHVFNLLAIHPSPPHTTLVDGVEKVTPFDPSLHTLHTCVVLDPNPLTTPPVSKAEWDDYHHQLAAGKVNPTDPSPLDFQFKIRILTFDRPRSLARLLDSLNQVLWDDDVHIALEVSIDYPRDLTDEESVHNWRLVATICDSFTWKYGTYSVIHQQQNIGLTGQWTWGWNTPDREAREIILFLEDDTSLVPLAWRWMKKVIQHYYLNPYNYDPNLYGFSLQSQHTVLGESKQYRYGSRPVHDMMSHSTFYYRYQLLGTWGTVFFPGHWSTFTSWLKSRSFQHTQGRSAVDFKPCVPTLLSNAWWQANPKRVWSQWMVRFAFEKGWYSLYTNFRNQSSIVVNFREGGLNFKTARGPMNPPIEELPEEYMKLPPSQELPLYDFHFRNWQHQTNHLKYHHAIMGANIPPNPVEASNVGQPKNLPPGVVRDDCYIINDLKKVTKLKEDTAKAIKDEAARKEAERRAAIEAEKHHAWLIEQVALNATLAAVELRRAEADARAAAAAAALESELSAANAKAKADRLRARKERAAAERESLRQREAADADEERKMAVLETLAIELARRAADNKKAKQERAEAMARLAREEEEEEEEKDHTNTNVDESNSKDVKNTNPAGKDADHADKKKIHPNEKDKKSNVDKKTSESDKSKKAENDKKKVTEDKKKSEEKKKVDEKKKSEQDKNKSNDKKKAVEEKKKKKKKEEEKKKADDKKKTDDKKKSDVNKKSADTKKASDQKAEDDKKKKPDAKK